MLFSDVIATSCRSTKLLQTAQPYDICLIDVEDTWKPKK
jgi:hypothetical protein